jgi:hypothetical protein
MFIKLHETIVYADLATHFINHRTLVTHDPTLFMFVFLAATIETIEE